MAGQNAAPAFLANRGRLGEIDPLSFLLALAAIFGWLNCRLSGLRLTVGLLLLALAGAVLSIAVDGSGLK